MVRRTVCSSGVATRALPRCSGLVAFVTTSGSCPVCYLPCAMYGCTKSWCVKLQGVTASAAIGTCPHCSRSSGWHYYGCSAMPKNGNRPCKDCSGANGHHTLSCLTRASTGAHAPTQRPAAAAVLRKCECGVDAAGVGGLHSSWCAKAETRA